MGQHLRYYVNRERQFGGIKKMKILTAVLLLILAVMAGGRKKAPDDQEWIDRLEELDAMIDDD